MYTLKPAQGQTYALNGEPQNDCKVLFQGFPAWGLLTCKKVNGILTVIFTPYSIGGMDYNFVVGTTLQGYYDPKTGCALVIREPIDV